MNWAIVRKSSSSAREIIKSRAPNNYFFTIAQAIPKSIKMELVFIERRALQGRNFTYAHVDHLHPKYKRRKNRYHNKSYAKIGKINAKTTRVSSCNWRQ